MKAHIKLGRIFGVAIGLHYSWIIIALLVTLSLRAQFAMEHPNGTVVTLHFCNRSLSKAGSHVIIYQEP
jgi:hypothetical protein